MRWLMSLLLIGLAPAVSADSLSVCYNYDCLAEAEVNYGAEQLTRVRDLLGVARNAAEERERLSLAIGWLLGWAGEQTPISADRGGNFADDGVFGRMDCIDHSTTTTRLLRLLESHRWLSFHRVLEPVRRVLYLFEVHYSAQIEEIESLTTASALAAAPARYVVDSWFRDNGRPAVVMALPSWLDGQGWEESGVSVVAGGLGDGSPIEH
ncbi:MAG: hypothetical protein ABTS16_10795 [Candidatus Accumulibacter phosphatis]|jgi:hypothetical protein|uniref:Uncharacterized protein n=2 Tax=Candidatus Accumulibacter TaxID=327159 RepID=A0A080LSJ3_9PROT|nr:hypothetical protein [Candidatus Accumulibacter contiguus]KFB71382.1 MAG: hypothetical protein AW09_003484 [Candidatus Accumulibacter phosphatis]